MKQDWGLSWKLLEVDCKNVFVLAFFLNDCHNSNLIWKLQCNFHLASFFKGASLNVIESNWKFNYWAPNRIQPVYFGTSTPQAPSLSVSWLWYHDKISKLSAPLAKNCGLLQSLYNYGKWLAGHTATNKPILMKATRLVCSPARKSNFSQQTRVTVMLSSALPASAYGCKYLATVAKTCSKHTLPTRVKFIPLL